MRGRMRTLMAGMVILCGGLLVAGPARGQEGGGGGGRGRMIALPGLLRQESVQKELGLSTDVIAKLKEIVGERGEALRNLRDMPEEERRAAMAEQAKVIREQESAIEKVLDGKQLDRLRQIRVQALGPRALMDEKVAEQIGLTADQQATLRKTMEEARQGERGPEMRQKLEATVQGMLTAEQKTKLETLRGKPFDVSTLQMRGPGGGPRRQ